jgi:transcription factor SFP1
MPRDWLRKGLQEPKWFEVPQDCKFSCGSVTEFLLIRVQHGHNNQRLHENGDGTFSIVDPDTQAPYPGTMGMEKEKPYKCDVCQKRYKNLNGLKYHKTHSPPCDPDLPANKNLSQNMSTVPNPGHLGAGLSDDISMMQ